MKDEKKKEERKNVEEAIRFIKPEKAPIKVIRYKELLFEKFKELFTPGKEDYIIEIDLKTLGLSYQGLRYIVDLWNKEFLNHRIYGRLGLKVKNVRKHPIAYVYRVDLTRLIKPF